MLHSLLSTKLYFPPARAALVPRPRLIARLQAGLTGPLTIISAPAGYGKTTLLIAWHAGCGSQFPAAWFSIDGEDNDPVRFWNYVATALAAAVETTGPGLSEAFSPFLQSVQISKPEALMTCLINGVRHFPRDFALILEDYHSINNPEIHAALTYLVEHLPPCMHLVLSTRSDPMLPLARLRARGQLVEIRANDLCFTLKEVAEFLNIAMGLHLTVEEVNTLSQRTEGWIAGLQMAALSMQGKEDVSGFIRSFTGNNRYVLDYLAEEVLHQQPEETRCFLLSTSILSRLTGPLCDAVTGEQNGEQMLADLERQNLFLVPLDDERRWYRYHHLMSDLLFIRLKQESKTRLVTLYLRAAGWCEQNGLLEEAVRYAMAAHDDERTARLLSLVKDQIWGRGDVRTMREWLQQLPKAFFNTRPHDCLAYAAGLTISGYTETAETWLRIAEEDLQARINPPADAWLMQAQLSIYRSVHARFRGDLPGAIALSQHGLTLLQGRNQRGEGVALLFLGHACFYDGDMPMAEKVLVQAIQANRASGHTAACINACHHLAQLYVLQGRLHMARTTYQQAIEYARSEEPAVYVGVEHAGLGDLYREWNQLDRAAAELQQAVPLAEMSDDIFFLRDTYLNAARLAQSQAQWESAHSFLYKAEQVVRRCPISVDIGLVQAWQARLHLASGNVEEAGYWARTCGLRIEGDLSFLNEFGHLTLARTLYHMGEYRQANSLLARLLAAAGTGGRPGRVMEGWILQSLLHRAEGDLDQALTVIDRALALAEPEGYLRIFTEEGTAMLDLLRRAASRGLHPAYVRRLLSTFEAEGTLEASNQPLIEPLSQRELEILQLLAVGKSNQEIASILFLAIGTIKRHVSNIFEKMNVGSRTECIARARELGIIQ